MAETEAELWQAFRRAVLARFRRDVEEENRQAEALRAAVVPKVEEAIRVARARGLCGRAWLFGSFAWDKPREGSDVDVMVEASRDPDEVAALVDHACERLVHLVPMEKAPASLRERVLKEGHPL